MYTVELPVMRNTHASYRLNVAKGNGTFHLTRTNCSPHTQPGRGVVIIAPPTVRYSEQFLYAAILRRASHCVRYPEFGGCPLFGCFYCIICMETAVGACNSIHYLVDVRYWECPLIESPCTVVVVIHNYYEWYVYIL